MAALPAERTTLDRPFTNTGVDFAGPFSIKSFTSRFCRITKGYVLVFVCFATKAIHLELTSEVSTPSFMAAFVRFFSRRSSPSALYSDNVTAIVGAANVNALDQAQLISNIREKRLSQYPFQVILWHFIPLGAPYMGSS